MRKVSSRTSPTSSGRRRRGTGALTVGSILPWRTPRLGPRRTLKVVGEVGDVSRAGRDRVRVLFVEDDPSVAQMYKLKLELDGYDVEVASDGEQALEVARRQAPDIIFLDIRLPKLDGFGVLEALREDPKTANVPVVILSNHSEK